jgi:Na+-transporting methylmalonyl-CoA/oxaloacetate decarboxylase gamma subunit
MDTHRRAWMDVNTMDNFTFGLTLTVLGMGGTFVSLWLLSLLIQGVKKLYPLEPEKPAGTGKE